MDEKGATYLSELATREAAAAPATSDGLPMYLLMVSGGIPGAMLRLLSQGTRLGRALDNTYPISDPSVSRHHAMIGIDAEEGARLTDLASVNGTFVNGRRLVPQTPTRLHDGDKIQIGASVVLKFVRLDPFDEKFQREMFERIVRDELTGLYNRSYFLKQIASLAGFAATRKLGLALLMLDIDHFKRVNDSFGHSVGDQVLREVAQSLRESTRPEDLVARYGGEEFIAALPVSAPDLATERAERIRVSLAERRIVTDHAIVRVTASLGLAFAGAGSYRSVDELIGIADRALYEAKRAGRDRVVFRNGPPASTLEIGEMGTK